MRCMSKESHRIPTQVCAPGPTRNIRTVFKPPNLNEIQAAADIRSAAWRFPPRRGTMRSVNTHRRLVLKCGIAGGALFLPL